MGIPPLDPNPPIGGLRPSSTLYAILFSRKAEYKMRNTMEHFFCNECLNTKPCEMLLPKNAIMEMERHEICTAHRSLEAVWVKTKIKGTRKKYGSG